jgi:hypothetical protein
MRPIEKADLTWFRKALAALRTALRAPDILRSDEQIVVELPYDAGQRFELWIKLNAPPEALYSHDWFSDDGPLRTFTIEGVKVRWPLRRLG